MMGCVVIVVIVVVGICGFCVVIEVGNYVFSHLQFVQTNYAVVHGSTSVQINRDIDF